MVNKATIVAAKAATTKTTQPMLILYSKFCSHLCMPHQETGNAINDAMSTSFKKSFESIVKILPTVAPNTFLTLISLVRYCVVYAARPNKPMHAIKMASVENMVKNF